MDDKYESLKKLGWSDELIEKFTIMPAYTPAKTPGFGFNSESSYADSKDFVLNSASFHNKLGLIY